MYRHLLKGSFCYSLLISSFFFLQSISIETHQNDSNFFIEEGFVTFATSNYFSLLEVLLDSIKVFSTRPIVAFGINSDIPFSKEKYPFLIKKRINVDLQRINIFSLKPRIIYQSGIRYGIYVEADDIVNYGVDNLFERCKRVHQFPLCPIHPKDPNDQENFMQAMGVSKKSMPYVHAHVLYSYRCLPFISEWYRKCLKYQHLGANYDETVLNVLLWKYNVQDLTNLYDPKYKAFINFLKGEVYGEYKDPTLNVEFYLLHGCKSPVLARKFLNLLIQIQQREKSKKKFYA